ncbi:polypyrimidine tract-binding protein 3-like [Oppia nitens]|uniref:polypyrimidine tract-binding protein 3-like n=1 Tax=Oppia nitens TaxID=1686743 RepID=UPI0023DC380C|nr:polypyrimidine tract-binding protein 3-like [Oppia nitens]
MTKRSQDDLAMDSKTSVEVINGCVVVPDDGSSPVIVAQTSPTTTTTTTTIVVDNNQNTINENELSTKKIKYETSSGTNGPKDDLNNNQTTNNRSINGPPIKSRVVHVRNIPVDTTDSDLIGLAAGFGRVTNCLILRGKAQAFVEFLESHSAQQMVNYWLSSTVAGIPAPMQPNIRGRHVFCQLSNHKELKTNNQNNSGSNGHNGNGDHGFGGHSVGGGGHHPHSGHDNGVSREPSCVLRVVVENALYAMSLDLLHSVFARAGKVHKIVTFTKNQQFQALIQMATPTDAQTARTLLDGQNLFHPNANQLRVEFSKLTQLNVKFNNDKSRDFTQTPVGGVGGQPMAADHSSALQHAHVAAAAAQLQQQQHHHHQQQQQQHNDALNALLAQQQSQHPSFGPFVGQTAALRALNPLLPLTAAGALGQLGLGLGQQLGNGIIGGHSGLQTPVLLVSNLNEGTTTTDALFTLFGVYGDVIRVKILFNKKDNALVQMAEPGQAALAHNYLDKVRLHGRVIRVTPSKHQVVQMPKEGQHDAGLTKDFSSSALHRFKKPGSKNYGNIYPPSATLHLSNIPASVQEEDIRQAFQQECQTQVVAFKFFPKDRKMALIQLSSVDDSIHALIQMHNYQLSESSHLRVSFSKSSI